MSGARTHARGFTLIEVMVAMAIFAVMAVIMFGGFNFISAQTVWSSERAARLQQIQTTMLYLSRDISQLQPRPVRSEIGDFREPALSADARSNDLLTLTRGGWGNPAFLPRGTLQRVTYAIEDDVLMRIDWPVLDRSSGLIPRRNELIDGVERLDVRYLDSTLEWHEEWPPLGSRNLIAPWLRPIAIELTLKLDDRGEIKRLVEISGA